MSDALSIWWLALCAASLFNAGAWAWSARLLAGRRDEFTPDTYAARRVLLWLSAAYVLGCGFRSFLPMIDVPRMCLHDTWISRIVVGRSIATVAELCFVAQWAILLREAGVAGNQRFAGRVAAALVPLIVIAELASWHAVLATNNLSHAIENSLWTVSAAAAMVACVFLRPRLDDAGRRFLTSVIVCAAGYVLFMVTIDVPMYLSRWFADAAAAHEYLPLREGLRDIVQRCLVVRDWAAWREDALWLTLYFTLAVWISIALPHVPPFRAERHSRASASAAVQPE